MMNRFQFLIFNLFFCCTLYAQDVLIPYKKDGQFGMVNQKGEMVVKPEFDGLYWLTGKYFISTLKNQEQDLHGLFYKDKELIKPQPSLIYRVIPETMILGVLKDENAKVYFVLYDYNGQRVESANYNRIELIATAGSSGRDESKPRFALLYAEDLEQRPGLFIYDSDERKIKEWFFQSVNDFKILEKTKNNDTYYLSYTDIDNQAQRKTIKITKDYFFMEDLVGEVPEPKVVGVENKPVVKSRTAEPKKNIKKSLYKEENGILIFQNDDGTNEIHLDKEIEPIFKYTKIKNQVGSLIYKNGHKYGWISDGKTTPAIYDSLAYFGNELFLACNNTGGKLKCGTFNTELQQVMPIEYDSILGVMNRFEFVPQSGTKDFRLQMKSGNIKTNPNEISYSLPVIGRIVAYKNGKARMMREDGTTVFPIEFDEIGRNGLNIPGEVRTDYIVTKKDGKYGLILSVYDAEINENLMHIMEPVFQDFPAFAIKNYYEQPAFVLIGLYDENGHFSSYASDFGVVYADEK